MPSTQLVHLDKALSNISIGYQNADLIADQIFKPVPVDKQSDRYYVYGKEMFRLNDDRRAPGTSANEITYTLSIDSYFSEGHALRHFIPDEEIQNADEVFQLEADSTALVSQGILMNKEADAAAKLLDSSNYDSSLVTATGGGGQPKKWSADDSDPVVDIEAAKVRIHKISGLIPNTLILSYPVYSRLRVHPKLLSYFHLTNVSIVPLAMMKEFFDIENILIGKALKSTTLDMAKGNDTLGYIWGKSAVLAYIPTAAARKTPAIGYSFMWNKDGAGAVQVRRWYDIDRRATIIEAERWYSQKIVSGVAGNLFPDVIA
jgi:hypothetical protein